MWKYVVVGLSLCLEVTALAQLQSKSAPATTDSGGSLIVNIDNPSFRRLIMATPNFVPEKANGELEALGQEGATQLGQLLTFSGLFNIMASTAYKEVMGKVGPRIVKSSETIFGEGVKTLEQVDVPQWKAIGVEGLTLASLSQDKDGFILSIRTYDINRNQILVGKRYTKIKKAEFSAVIRRYADLVLQAYTGKPGIFNSKIVFIGRPSKAAAKQVYMCDFDGTNVRAITSGNVPHLSPNWSQDGQFITYTSYQDGNPDLFIYEVATRKKRKLSGYKGINSGSAWAPGDKLIAFTGSVNGDANIYAVPPEGGDRKLVIAGSGLDVDPTFSPDKKYMAFVSGRYGNPHIFRATLKWDGETKVSVIDDLRLTFAGWYNAVPAWSPESDKIAFAGYDKDIDRWDVFIMNPDGKKLERLTLRAGDNESPSFAPNGQLIVFHSSRTDGKDVKTVAQLFMMNRDGANQHVIPTGLYEAQTPKWSNQLAY